MKPGYWTLDAEHRLIPTDDVHVWGEFFEDKKARTVGNDQVGDITVSTVFLGMDHNWFDNGPPLLFETMIFGGDHDQWQDRYPTWDAAQIGHERVVAVLRAGDAP